MSILIRYANKDELGRVNEIRRMVYDVHVNGRPDIFRSGFDKEFKEQLYQKYDSDSSDVIVVIIDNTICGYATVEYIDKPPSPFSYARRYYYVDEYGVDTAYRRLGVASALIVFCKNEAAGKGYKKIELNVWEFNESAIKFYESAGFRTYRRYMEMNV